MVEATIPLWIIPPAMGQGRAVGAWSGCRETPLAQGNGMAVAADRGPSPQSGAVLCLLLAAFSFSLMTVCVKGAGARLPVAEVVHLKVAVEEVDY